VGGRLRVGEEKGVGRWGRGTAAVTQTYGYITENNLEYTKSATCEADVFLQVQEDEPHTLITTAQNPT
jgi:hypothetical protein